MEIWEQIAADPESGTRALVGHYGGRLLAAARLLSHDSARAEDLTFRTLERAVERIRDYRPTGSFYAWLYRILLNFFRMEQRGPGMRRLVYSDTLPETVDPREDAAAALVRAQTGDAVRAAVARLSPPLREVVVLRYFEDLDLAEIAGILGIGVGTVKSRLFNAKARLTGILGEDARP